MIALIAVYRVVGGISFPCCRGLNVTQLLMPDCVATVHKAKFEDDLMHMSCNLAEQLERFQPIQSSLLLEFSPV